VFSNASSEGKKICSGEGAATAGKGEKKREIGENRGKITSIS
jgi:hypothetical protein